MKYKSSVLIVLLALLVFSCIEVKKESNENAEEEEVFDTSSKAKIALSEESSTAYSADGDSLGVINISDSSTKANRLITKNERYLISFKGSLEGAEIKEHQIPVLVKGKYRLELKSVKDKEGKSLAKAALLKNGIREEAFAEYQAVELNKGKQKIQVFGDVQVLKKNLILSYELIVYKSE